jgi:hypothetical protein
MPGASVQVGGTQTIFITVTDDSGLRVTVERLLENFYYGPHQVNSGQRSSAPVTQ